MSTYVEGFTESSAVRLRHLRLDGAGTPVVFLHGLMGSGSCWGPIARALRGEFEVVLPDARGHGRSSAPDDGYSYDEHAADVTSLIHSLELNRPVLVGHSMGGMTAAIVAAQLGEELSGLILVDPTFISPEWQQEVWESNVIDDHRAALTRTKAALLADAQTRHPLRTDEMIEHQVQARLDTSVQALDVLAPPNPEFRPLVRSFEVPCLLVVGDSTLVSYELASELSSLSPNLAIEKVPGAGHGLPFDYPEALAAIVLSFLRSLK